MLKCTYLFREVITCLNGNIIIEIEIVFGEDLINHVWQAVIILDILAEVICVK